MSKHTSGPWVIYGEDEVSDGVPTVEIATGGDNYQCIANVAASWVDDDLIINDETYANARLIAAAPEMLEALKRAEKFIQNGLELGYIRMPDPEVPDPAHQTLPAIQAAIAKAEAR